MPRNLPKQVDEVLKQDAPAESPEMPETEPEEMGMTPVFGIPKKRPVFKIKVKQYRVDRGPLPSGGWVVVLNGARTELGMGKVIDERQYDIAKLKLMGVQLADAGEIEV